FLLDALGGGFADQTAVVTAHVGDDGFIEAITADTYGFGVDHAVEGDQSNFRGAAANVDDHRAARLVYRQASPDCGGHGFLDQEHFTRSGAQCRLTDGAAFHLGGLARHADQHARAWLQEAVLVNLVD